MSNLGDDGRKDKGVSGNDTRENIETSTTTDNIIKDEKSSSFPFGSVVQTDLASAFYDQSSCSAAVLDDIPHTDSIDNLLANLAEDNANSLPSAVDDTEFTLLTEAHTEEETVSETIKDDFQTEEIVNHVLHEVCEAMEIPAVEESKSDAAIAEDLQNGENSEDTRVDIDAEMVSEDELPAPSQEKVDDAEEVSDEELPGPKLAELPADTEVVSEDELPSSNKVKRKVDEGYDPGSPTESSEAPEKKAKSEETGKISFFK